LLNFHRAVRLATIAGFLCMGALMVLVLVAATNG
jgi:hypothetical protein